MYLTVFKLFNLNEFKMGDITITIQSLLTYIESSVVKTIKFQKYWYIQNKRRVRETEN